MTTDRIEVVTPPATDRLPLKLDRIRSLAYYDEGYVDNDTLRERTQACVELFEQETQQVLLASTLKATFPREKLLDGAAPVLPLHIPGLETTVTALTEGGRDILASVKQVKQRHTSSVKLYPDGCWSGEEIVATFTAGLPPDGSLPSLVVEILGDALRWRYLQDQGAGVIFYNLIKKWTL